MYHAEQDSRGSIVVSRIRLLLLHRLSDTSATPCFACTFCDLDFTSSNLSLASARGVALHATQHWVIFISYFSFTARSRLRLHWPPPYSHHVLMPIVSYLRPSRDSTMRDTVDAIPLPMCYVLARNSFRSVSRQNCQTMPAASSWIVFRSILIVVLIFHSTDIQFTLISTASEAASYS